MLSASLDDFVKLHFLVAVFWKLGVHQFSKIVRVYPLSKLNGR